MPSVPCGMQKYLYVPAFANVYEYVVKPIGALSGAASCLPGSPLLTLCVSPDAAVQVTLVPTFTFSVLGGKATPAACTELGGRAWVADGVGAVEPFSDGSA